MKQQLLFLTILLGWAAQAHAQGNYRPGYIVQLSGDTLRGEVQQRSEVRSATQCHFRLTGTADARDYQPAQLQAYGLDEGAVYQARLVPGTALEPATLVFARALAIGPASLYTRRTADDETHFYLAMGTDSLQELVQRRVARMAGDQTVYENQYPFRTVLAKKLQACLSVQPLLPQLLLAANELTKVIDRYNACVGGGTAVARPLPQEASRVKVGLVAGANVTRLSFADNPSLRNGSFTTFGSPVGGVFLELVTPALNRNFTFRLDALYEYLSYADSYVTRNVSTVDLRQRASLKLNYLKVPLQVRYRFHTGQFQPFLLVGASFSYLLAYDTQFHSEYTSASGGLVVFDGPGITDEGQVARADYGVLAGVGLATPGIAGHAIGVELRGEQGSGFLNKGSTSKHLGILVSISLTK